MMKSNEAIKFFKDKKPKNELSEKIGRLKMLAKQTEKQK